MFKLKGKSQSVFISEIVEMAQEDGWVFKGISEARLECWKDTFCLIIDDWDEFLEYFPVCSEGNFPNWANLKSNEKTSYVMGRHQALWDVAFSSKDFYGKDYECELKRMGSEENEKMFKIGYHEKICNQMAVKESYSAML